MRLRTRFTVVIAGVVAALFCGYLTSLYVIEKKHLEGAAEKSRRDQAEKLALLCQESVLSKDEIILINYLRGLARSEHVLWAMYQSPDGRVMTHSDFALKNRVLDDAPSRAARNAEGPLRQLYAVGSGSEILEYAAPVLLENKTIGVARVGFDASAVRRESEEALRQTVRRFAGITGMSLVFAVLIASLVARGLTRPLQELTDGVEKIGAGERRVAIPAERRDEIGNLARAFNVMSVRLGELDELKDQFIQNVSHDLRNPLGAIAIAAQHLMTRGGALSTEERGNILKVILTSTGRLRMMVNNILDTAKMKDGRLEYQKEPFAPEKAIREIYNLYEFSANEGGKTLRVDVPADLPRVLGDEEKVHRIILNLFTNALKFTREGDTISLGARRGADPGWVEFFVSDTGPGLPTQEIPHLFRRFSSVTDVVDPAVRKKQGAGLGLSIVKALVEGHGGQVKVESAPGRGTTFRWTLPVYREDA